MLNERLQVSDYVKTCTMTHVGVDELGAALVELAIRGGETRCHENEDFGGAR